MNAYNTIEEQMPTFSLDIAFKFVDATGILSFGVVQTHNKLFLIYRLRWTL